MKPRITVSIPCFGRPKRTLRAIDCIMNQDINGWEAFIMGDCCPDFQRLIDSGYLEEKKKEAESKGNILHYFNAEVNGGGCGYKLTNYAIENATGEYFVFYANDDIILPNHFSSYLSEIENTDYDFVYYDSYLDPINSKRGVRLAYCYIGHSEMIIRTDFLKTITPHSPEYGHDWTMIAEMIKKGKHKRGLVDNYTYIVMRLPNKGTKDKID